MKELKLNRIEKAVDMGIVESDEACSVMLNYCPADIFRSIEHMNSIKERGEGCFQNSLSLELSCIRCWTKDASGI